MKRNVGKGAMKQQRKPKNTSTVVIIRIDEWDKGEIQCLADRFAKGNLSAWFRTAAMRYRMRRGERLSKVS